MADHKSILAAALDGSAKRFKRDLFKEFPLEAMIIEIMDEKSILIDIGTRDGAKKGTKMAAYDVKQTKHPRTGKILTRYVAVKGTLRIKSVEGDDTSVVKGGKGVIKKLKAGMVLRSVNQLFIPR